MQEVTLTTPTSYLGRNGYGKTTALMITPLTDELHISPVNSRSQIAPCTIAIPYADVEAFIRALRQAVPA
jgi:hypothetical protein